VSRNTMGRPKPNTSLASAQATGERKATNSTKSESKNRRTTFLGYHSRANAGIRPPGSDENPACSEDLQRCRHPKKSASAQPVIRHASEAVAQKSAQTERHRNEERLAAGPLGFRHAPADVSHCGHIERTEGEPVQQGREHQGHRLG